MQKENLKINWFALKMRVDENQKNEAEDWIKRKGIDLYLKVINAFSTVFRDEEVFEYEEIASFIRHDKSLRNLLYGYLALLEEELRALITNNYEINRKDIEVKIKDYKSIKLFQRIDHQNCSNLSLKFDQDKISFCKLIDFAHENNILSDLEAQYYHSIRKKIRNLTMHHSFLLICDDKKEQENECIIRNIKPIIESITKLLPNNSYKTTFEKKLQNLLKVDKKNFTRITFEGINNASK